MTRYFTAVALLLPCNAAKCDEIGKMISKSFGETTMRSYDEISRALDALLSGGDNLISMLSNASALLWQELSEVNWVGFYAADGGKLTLYPFQGKPACIEIPFGKGVCGTAASEDRPILVPNVHEFSGHIACDAASNSEIVVPIHFSGAVAGVLDIDSPKVGRFDESDMTGLMMCAGVIERHWERCARER